MQKILQIYKNDIKVIFKNYAALITIIALIILPSLYAWFNIAASWDPYSQKSTSQIKIGVVNEDKGSSIRGEKINLGDKIVESLKENNLMGWTFLDKDTSDELLNEGKIYASILIPENFSNDITSVATSDIKKGDIIYKVNEKINAIAPKLTIKGASGVQEKIDKTLIETVSSVLLTETKNLGIELEEAKPKITNVYNTLKEVQSKFTELNQTIDLAKDGVVKVKDLSKSVENDIPLIEDTLNNSKNLTSNVKEFIYSSRNSLEELSPMIKEDIRIASEISNDILTNTDFIITAVEDESEDIPEFIDNVLNKANNLQGLIQSISKILEGMNKFNPKLNDVILSLQKINSNINSMKTTLETVKQSINSGEKPNLSMLNNLKTFSESISSITSDLYANYDSKVSSKIKEIFDQTYNTSENILNILSEAQEKLPEVSSILSSAYTSADKGIDVLDFAKEKLPQAEEIVNLLIEKMDKINNDKEFQELIDMLKSDVKERSDFLANPVNLVEEDLFPMGNYGTAMTPFYTTLSLWTGVLFLVSLLSVGVHNDNYNAIQIYFGKILLFITIAILQSIVVGIGDLYFLKIYCLHPLYFMLSCILTSIIFTAIIYTACSVFGNAGKVICIVLLVFQIGGSGGTFPIELTPIFFQSIHPFLPFTYTISLMRETIGGIVKNIVAKDITIILIFIAISVLVGVFLKKIFNNTIKSFSEKFHESNLGE